MRKLTVKNFSVIKDAELEFGKITVLIGPQSSGKSLLCKLAYFLGPTLTQIIAEFAARQRTWSDLEEFASNQFQQRFPESAWGTAEFLIDYEQGRFGVKAIGESSENGQRVSIVFSEGIRTFYAGKLSAPWGGPHKPGNEFGALTTSFRSWNYLVELNVLQGHRKVETSAFIPANRAFFSNLNNVFELFRNENIDITLREFAASLDWADKPTSERSVPAVRTEILASIESIQGGKVRIDNGKPAFEGPNGVIIPMGLTSSGTQELVPLFMLLSTLVKDTFTGNSDNGPSPIRERFLFVEEPEGHVFPSTQYELVRLFSWLQNEVSFQFSWVITTHSPYILSSFNNFIYAGQLGKDKAISRKIPIEEKYWIEPGAFAAYSIHDGICESILSKSGLIDGEYLDSVSEKIANEFDSLLRLEYDKTKAS
jgi:energy-coupling factor transporter ATP-binding protein EcfA2